MSVTGRSDLRQALCKSLIRSRWEMNRRDPFLVKTTLSFQDMLGVYLDQSHFFDFFLGAGLLLAASSFMRVYSVAGILAEFGMDSMF